MKPWSAGLNDPTYIDRRTSSVDKPFKVADIATNVKVEPNGRLTLRDGNSEVFPVRRGWFEGTTLFAGRMVDDDLITDFTQAWKSTHRHCILEGVSSVGRYRFMLVQTVTMAVCLYRGVVQANGEVDPATWSKIIVQVGAGGGLVYLSSDAPGNLQCWMEASMCMNAAGTEIYVAIVDRNSTAGGNSSVLTVRKLTNLYTAGWNPQNDLCELDTAHHTDITVTGDDAITHDVDICYDLDDAVPTVVNGYWNNTSGHYELHLRRVGGVYFINEPEKIDDAAFDFFGVSMFYDSVNSKRVMIYIKNGVTKSMKGERWVGNSVYQTKTLTAVFKIETTLPNALFTSGMETASDASGDIHVLYRIDTTHLAHALWDVSANSVTVDDLTTLFTLLNTYTLTPPSGTVELREDLTNWCLVVRGGCVFVFYVDSTGYTIRRCQSIDGAAFALHPNPIHVSQSTVSQATEVKHIMYLSADRTYRTDAPKTVSFFDIVRYDPAPGPGAVQLFLDFMQFRDEWDAEDAELLIEMIKDTSLTEAGASTGVQHKIVHCSNNRLYKRSAVSWHWEVLENTFDKDNARESWWRAMEPTLANGGFGLSVAPNPVTHVNFNERKGVITAGYGVGQYLCGANYRQINRVFFDNSTTYDYRDHFLDVDKILPAPTSDILVPTVGGMTLFGRDCGHAVSNIIGYTTGGVQTFITWHNVVPVNSPKYRLAAWTEGDHRQGDEEFAQGVTLLKRSDKTAPYTTLRGFHVGLTYIYDGFQESQIYVVPSANIYQFDWGRLGLQTDEPVLENSEGMVFMGTWQTADNSAYILLKAITVNLQLKKLIHQNLTGLNPRITGVRVWLGECNTILQTVKDTVFYPAKTIIISKNDTIKDEWWNGEKPWEWNSVTGYFEHNPGASLGNYWPVVIDVDDYLQMLKLGAYESIQGHSDTLFDTTLGLTRSPFPESYKDSCNFGNKLLLGGVRVDGVDRPNRLLINAVRSDDGNTYETPDVYSDQDAIDLDFKIQKIAKLDDQTAIVIGDRGIVTLDVNTNQYRKLDGNYGTDAPDSVADLSISREGIVFLYKSIMRLFEGYTDPTLLSDQVTDDSAIGSVTGIKSITDQTDCWAFYLGAFKRLVLIFRVSPYAGANNPIFTYEMIQSPYGWLQAYFKDGFKCGCVGIGDYLYWSTGVKVFKYPDTNADNAVNFDPDFRTADAQLPKGMLLDIEELFVQNKVNVGCNLTATIIRDRNTALNIVQTIAGTGLVEDTRRKPRMDTGRMAKKSVSVRLQATAPTVFDIEDLTINGLPKERIY